MTLDQVMTNEREALMTEYCFPEGFAKTQVPFYCAVADFEILKHTPSQLRSRFPIQMIPLSPQHRGKSFVQICPGLGYKFLWAHSANDEYRDDYLVFLRDHHKLPISQLPPSCHVDHLFNRERAKAQGLIYIRMVLLPASVNTSHGAGYEKGRTQSGIGSPGRARGIDEINLMKLWGVKSPRKGMPLSPEVKDHLNHMAARFGLPPSALEQNIRELMEVAAFRPA
jgi:hypothetical protein